MSQFMIIAQFDYEPKAYFTEFSETVSNMCQMFREMERPYEVYMYNKEYGYQRTARWPAA